MKGLFLALCGALIGLLVVPAIGAVIAYQSGIWVSGTGSVPAGTGDAALAGGLYYLTAFFPINLFLALAGGGAGLVLGSPLFRFRRNPVSA